MSNFSRHSLGYVTVYQYSGFGIQRMLKCFLWYSELLIIP